MATKIQFRRDTSTNWENTDPTLSQGEPGFDLDRGLIKVGNGSSNWNCLPFQGTGERPNGAVAVGYDAGACCQGTRSVAIGHSAGRSSQSYVAVAIGRSAGECCQSTGATAVGHIAGYYYQGYHATAVGRKAAQYNQEQYATAIGAEAGQCCQSQYSVAIGYRAGNCDQGQGPWADGYAVAIGAYAGECCQQYHAVAIGREAGNCDQGFSAVAVGRSAGRCNQSNGAVAVGKSSGYNCQGQDAVAIGNYAGRYQQGNYAVAIGYRAGYACCCSQGQYSVAIGPYAGECYQESYSIAINADCGSLNPENQGFYVNPVRGFNTCFACGPDGGTVLTSVFYDPNTKEVIRAAQMPQNYIEANGNYRLELTDAGKHVYKVGTGDVMIDTHGNVAFPIGTTITLVTGSDNSTRIMPIDSGTTTLILSKFGADSSINVPVDTYVTILKIENDKWMVQT